MGNGQECFCLEVNTVKYNCIKIAGDCRRKRDSRKVCLMAGIPAYRFKRGKRFCDQIY